MFKGKGPGRWDKQKKQRRSLEDRMDALGDRLDRSMEPGDPIYSEPVYRKQPPLLESDYVLVKGPVDIPFLLIVVALAVFGAIMAYSASSVYAAQYHDDSAYYVKRHLFYLLVAFAVTAVFVIKARPWFWRMLGEDASSIPQV